MPYVEAKSQCWDQSYDKRAQKLVLSPCPLHPPRYIPQPSRIPDTGHTLELILEYCTIENVMFIDTFFIQYWVIILRNTKRDNK